MGPDAVLTALTRQCLDHNNDDGDGDGEGAVFASVLRARHPEPDTFAGFLAQAHTAGTSVDWPAFYTDTHARRVDLPTYAFQRQRFPLGRATVTGDPAAAGLGRVDHPFLRAAVRIGDRDEWLFTGRISPDTAPWVRDHAVLGMAVVPGAALVELALAAGRHAGSPALEELTLDVPLILDEESVTELQITLAEPDQYGHRAVAVYARPQTRDGDEQSTVICHARGVLAPEAQPFVEWLTEWPPAGAEPVAVDTFYKRLAEVGHDYGPLFQGLRAAWHDDTHLYTEVALPDGTDVDGFGIHPALLESAVHGGLLDRPANSLAELPSSWSGVRLGSGGHNRIWARIGPTDGGALQVDLVTEDGEPVASVASLAFRPVDQEWIEGTQGGQRRSLLQIDWVPVPVKHGAGPARFVLLGDLDGQGERYRDLDALEQALADGAPVPTAVLTSVGSFDAAGDVAQAAQATTEQTLALLQRWLASERLTDTQLVLVTRAAIAVGAEAADLAQAPVWGLVRSAQSEHPDRFVLMDVDADCAALEWTPLVGVDEPQLAVRGGRLFAPRLAPVGAPQVSVPHLDPDGIVLITGGTGALGTAVARHLVQARGARRLLLVSRRGPAWAGADELIAELAAFGCETRIVSVDVTDRTQLVGLFGGLERPLTAVVHAAGVLDDAVVESLTPEQLARVMRPKLAGALHLNELTAQMPLAAFVLFSSVAALVDSPGQGNYAAANAFLDALAANRRAAGLPAMSLAWGLWADATGMAGVLDEAGTARWARTGIQPMPTALGLDLFDEAQRWDRAVLVPVRLDLAALRTQARTGVLPALLRGLVPAPVRPTVALGGTLAQRLDGVPDSDREPVVVGLVQAETAVVLGHTSPAAIDPTRAFKELGFDSLAAVELRNRLAQTTGLPVPSTLVFNHPTPAAVARLLITLLDGAEPGSGRPVAPRPRRLAADEPLAIVGMSCRYPGGLDSPEEFWRLLVEGRDAIVGLPDDRGWDLERLYDPDPERVGSVYARGGGFLRGAGDFDAGFFGISPREALAMDPQQRLLLEGAWEAFEDAGIDPTSLRGSDTGVFCGVMSSEDYGGPARPESEGFRLTGTTNSVVSGRVAYTLGLEGPAVSVDTACSSSLVALHLAAQALRAGECSMALAGGVTVMAAPFLLVEFSRQRGLAADGRCKPYAAAADGTGFSDGLGLIVLERLSDARRNGHRVLGLLRGSAINSDGASNGLTAPNGPSQERLIRQALASAGLSPADVDVVEGHGTGTRLGDPIEAQALLATYGRERENGPLRLGSVKSNIGHASAAAGVAGVIKMVLAMRHGMLPATLHVDAPSPHVDWDGEQVTLLTRAEQWHSNGERLRRAGVSSFGVSGTNAHVILEEAPIESEAPVESEAAGRPLGAVPVVLSGRSELAVRGQAERLRSFLLDRPE
ncbi:type I polyketide synthase, partial [Micromonospora sp. DT201]